MHNSPIRSSSVSLSSAETSTLSALFLIPVLSIVNGPAVSFDQFAIRTALTAVVLCISAGLVARRLYSLIRSGRLKPAEAPEDGTSLTHQSRGGQPDVKQNGFTIVELVVVLSIIGLLASLLLPAVQMAREASRRASCSNNLRQLCLAFQLHSVTHSHLPTDGWGHSWVGDPDKGFGRWQPGGWPYNVLPFIEAGTVRELGAGEDGPTKSVSLSKVLVSRLSIFSCPSRRSSDLLPYTSTPALRNTSNPVKACKSDYAVCGGDFPVVSGPGPRSSAATDLQAYAWPDPAKFTGVCFARSTVRLAEVLDGTSNTYLLGEKYVSLPLYLTGNDAGDDQCMFIGDDADIRRWTFETPRRDGSAVENKEVFGSAHGACHFATCDGAVHSIDFGVDRVVNSRLGNRNDGYPLTPP